MAARQVARPPKRTDFEIVFITRQAEKAGPTASPSPATPPSTHGTDSPPPPPSKTNASTGYGPSWQPAPTTARRSSGTSTRSPTVADSGTSCNPRHRPKSKDGYCWNAANPATPNRPTGHANTDPESSGDGVTQILHGCYPDPPFTRASFVSQRGGWPDYELWA